MKKSFHFQYACFEALIGLLSRKCVESDAHDLMIQGHDHPIIPCLYYLNPLTSHFGIQE